MKKQNEVKCKTCGDSGKVKRCEYCPMEVCSNTCDYRIKTGSFVGTIRCPDCTALQPENTPVEVFKWRVNVPSLLNEILLNPGTGVLTKPLQIFAMILGNVAERARTMNDKEMNKLMLRLALYEEGDPYSKDYDSKKINEYLSSNTPDPQPTDDNFDKVERFLISEASEFVRGVPITNSAISSILYLGYKAALRQALEQEEL